jgi:glycosyltransferase involved in cell wall biosynthesis
LQLKALKKRLYLKAARALGLHSRVLWQVSSEHELRDAQAVIHADLRYHVKPPDMLSGSSADFQKPKKEKGKAKFAFISRISPKKNLLMAIELLANAPGDVDLTIYGPIEDEAYWQRCEAAIKALPLNATVLYAGPIPPHEVQEKLGKHHFFLFPTLGENFGHVIPEALFAGCPALLSDQTPWRDPAVGWVLPLDDSEAWATAISDCVEMDAKAYRRMSTKARKYAEQVATATSDPAVGMQMFESAARRAA